MPQSQGRIIAEGFGWRHVGRKKAALAGLDLVIEPGEKVLLAGASGAGKSTFLHALAGVLPEESGYREGSLTVDGAAPDPRSGTCGLVLQDPDSQVILSRVADDVAFGMENLRVDPALMPARIAEALATVGLDLAPDHPTSRLSGGQKQRLALAGVLAMEPTVWLLDEPTANVDPESLVVLRDAILAAARDSTMLLVEHRLPLWIDHVDRLVVLGPEGVVADGEPRTLMSDPATRALLAESGVWLPDSSGPVARPEAAVPAVRPPLLLSTRDLAVRRPGADTIASFVPDLEIRAGEALALTGPNGAGKTTTALTLGGLIPEASGEVVASPELLALEGEAGAEAFVSASRPKRGFLGRRARNASPHRPYTWTSAFLVPRIGSVFQEPEHQFLATTVAEELALGLEHTPLSPAERSARVDELLEVLGLTALARAHPHTLSGGQKRRLSVATMIAPRPRILVIDEPTFGQDARTWEGLVGLIRAVLAEGTAVVTVSHDREFVAAIGAREVVLTPAGSTMSVPNGRPAA